ncbi:unnamed protein product [Protopolystoma xenopodis]|uniref:Uncharacterized protein n=1 Tax=Protopolystoma xenopodis TaxID=117903 RepID=A0A3S5B3P4_9PLAT|nr:unnamed protein product [Protopolystoma xenopodis]
MATLVSDAGKTAGNLETRYYVVERYYGPEPRPPLSALPRISPAVCIHHPHHQQVVISLQVNQQNNIRGTVDTGINSVNPMNREVPWVSSYPIEQSTKKSALESKQRSFECIVAPDASVKSFDRQTGISMLHSPSLFMRPSEQPSKSIGTPRSPSCPGDPPWASQTTNDVVQTGPVLITNTNIGNSNNNSPRCSFAQASYTSGSILGCGPDSIPPQQQQRQQQQEHQNHSVRGLSVHFAA